MKKATLVIFALAIGLMLNAQTKEDTVGIKAAVMDYIEGFYKASEKRMENALHPELSKRIVDLRSGNLRNMNKETLVRVTKNKKNEEPDKGKMKADISIYDITNGNATVKCSTDKFAFFDYCHLGKVKGEWKIINVLWGHPEKKD